MAKTVAEKLRIRAGDTLITLNEPPSFRMGLGELPTGVRLTRTGIACNQVHWFVANRADMEAKLPKVMKLLKPGVLVWVYYPKGSSGLQTDLTRDKGWDALQAYDKKVTWISLISFDDTWSVFGFRAKTADDEKKELAPIPKREIFNWVDPVKKTVKLPADLAATFKKHKKEAILFESLSFTNKKEYLEWVVSAKREETRRERVKAVIERLSKGWKNPANR